jgi:urea transport system substrate-binding protein
LLRAAGVTPEKIPTVYFSIGEIELLSLSARGILGDYAVWNYFQSVDRSANRAFVESSFSPRIFEFSVAHDRCCRLESKGTLRITW